MPLLTDREKAISWITTIAANMTRRGIRVHEDTILQPSRDFISIMIPTMTDAEFLAIFHDMESTMIQDAPKMKNLHDQQLVKFMNRRPTEN